MAAFHHVNDVSGAERQPDDEPVPLKTASRSEPGVPDQQKRPFIRRPLLTRRTLQLALGVVWILDGALQFQPFMFSTGFAKQIILPTASGQPVFVSDPVHWASALILTHPLFWDAVFALVQLAIGAGLLFRRTVRPAIAVSIVWALGVWLLGEGLGGLASGATTFVAGAPGAVILYAVIGLAAWPQLGPERRRTVLGQRRRLTTRVQAFVSRSPDEAPARWVPLAWAVTWGLFSLLRALPGNNSGAALGSQIAASATGAPDWLAQAQHSIAHVLSLGGVAPAVLVVVVELAIGVLGLLPGRARVAAAWIGIVAALLVWVIGQAFGQIPTGMGTDPNSGPLVALLGVALLGRVRGTRAQEATARESDQDGPPWVRRLHVA